MPQEPEVIADDGLPVGDVGYWAEEKHRLVTFYATIFAGSMRGKWSSLSYLDLFAGPGRCRFRENQRLALTSPTRILGLPARFDRYLFCEQDPNLAAALRERALRQFPDRNAQVIEGDANSLAASIAAQIPANGLGFCFLDPYKLGNLSFNTIRSLASRRMDFLVLIPSGMDGQRNEQIYQKAGHMGVEHFCGASDWRDRWLVDRKQGKAFENFLVEEFGRSMAELGYIDGGLNRSHIIRSNERNLLLYRLALYSKDKLGDKFWKASQKYSTPQMSLGFE